MKISITGKFGTGKTIFSQYLSNNRIKIINADYIGKQLLYEKREEIFRYLSIEYEENYVDILKQFILKREENFIKYNKWMYEHLPIKILNECDNHDNVIVDAALIFEWGIEWYFDVNILIIDGDFEERFNRIGKSRKNINKKLYILLEKHQMKDNKKKKNADIIIYNNKTLKYLREKANEIYKNYFID